MKFEDIRKKYGIGTKEEEEEENKDKSSGKTTSRNLSYSEISKKHGVSFDVDENYLNDFIKAANEFSSVDEDSAYGAWSRLDLGTKASNVRGWLYHNKSNYSADDYNSLSNTVDNLVKFGTYFSSFNNEEAYLKSKRAERAYTEKLNFNLEEGQREIDALQNDYNGILETEDAIRRLEQENQTLKLAVAKGDRNSATKLAENEKKIASWNKMLEDAYKKYGGKNQLSATLSEKKQYYTLASRAQKGVELSSVINNEDFKANSQYKSTEFTPDNVWEKIFRTTEYDLGYEDLTHQYINGDDAFRDTVNRNHSIYAKDSTYADSESRFEKANYAEMTEDEINIYNYYYNTAGKEKAEEYLDSIQETLNYRAAQKTYAGLEGKVFQELLFTQVVGLDQYKTGLENLVTMLVSSEDYIPPSSTQLAGSMVREDLDDVGPKLPEWMGGASLGQLAYDMGTTTANMMPSIITSAVANVVAPGSGAVIGAGLLGASASGNAYAEMLNLGYDKGQARSYALLVGASEAGLQYALGGISKLGGKVTGNAISKFVNQFDNAIARTAIKLGGNMLSEGLEESIQSVLEPMFKALATGQEFESIAWEEVLYSGLMGALSAGILEGGSTIATEVKTYKQGKALQATGTESIDRLVSLGQTFSADSVAYQLAGKVNENTGAYTIGRLLNEVGASLSEQNKTDIADALVKKGMTETDAKTIAKWLGKAVDGQSLSKRQIAAIESNDVVASVLHDVIINPNSTVNQRIQGYNASLRTLAEEMSRGKATKATAKAADAQQTAAAPTETLSDEEYVRQVAEATGEDAAAVAQGFTRKAATPSVTENAPTEQNAVEGKFEASVKGETIVKETGKVVSVEEIVSNEGGNLMVKLDNGETVNASDLAFATAEEGLVYEMVAKMGVNPKTAMALVKAYNPSSGVKAQTYAIDIPLAYQYGKIGYQKGLERLNLTPEQRNTAYVLGRDDVMASGRTWSDTSRKTPETNKSRAADDGIIYEGFELNEDGLTDIQKASLAGIRTLAKMSSSLEFHVYQSIVENGKKYAIVNGKKIYTPNGFFRNGNEIYLDINAGKGTKGAMLYTASHEVVHFIAENSFEDFKALADFLFEHYGENNVPVEALIRREINKLKKGYEAEGKDMPSEDDLYMKAYEEVVANAMSKMLADPTSYEKLAKLKSENLSLWEKIGQAIKQMLAKLKSMLGIYEGRDTDQMAANYVDDFTAEVYDQLQDLYIKAFANAEANYQASIGTRNLEDFADAKNTEGDTLFQYKAMEADEDTYRDMLKKWGKMTDTQINNLFLTIDNAMELIKDNLEALDYAWEADIDDRAFSPVKPNSDKLYQVSLDFSTLCRKRILQQTVAVQLQEALNKPLTREEGIAIRDALIALQEEGRQIEVACALCYVESARMKSPEQIKRFIENREAVIKEFFAGKSGGSMKEKLKKAEADARERLHKENPDGIKGKDGKTMLDPRSASLKAMPKKYADEIRSAKKNAKQSYAPTAEEQRIIEVAKDMTVTDFTSPEGLENLAKNYPALFDAYTSYIRNATKSKGIENDTWWRAGDSTQIGDVLIANMNKENGLRSQSWSDFQVVHILDYIAATIELATRETKEQAYSKVPDYVELMGNTGVMINMSLIPTAQFNGSLDYDSVEGIDYKRALELRDKYHATAGTICIGVDNVQIKLLLEDITIDYVIPYHKSGMSAAIRKLMHIPTWSQYEEYQSEKNLARADAEKQAKKYGVKLLDASDSNYHKGPSFSEWFDLKEAQQIAKMENANPTDKAKHKKYGVMYGGYMAMQNAANNYLKFCAERGISPKFSHEKADFTAEDNYWKLLIDRKMVDNITGDVIEQKTIKPIFDEKEVMRILNDELERYPKVKADQDYAIRKVTEGMLSGAIKGGMSAEAVAKVMKTPVDNVTNVNIFASTEGDTLYSVDDYEDAESNGDHNRITIGMSDSERSEILKGKSIEAPIYEGQADEIISVNKKDLESRQRGLVKAALVRIGDEFKVFTDYDIQDVEVKITLSRTNLKESISKDASPVQLAKLLPLLEGAVGNAIGIESHSNRYYYDTDTVYFENLLGGYVDGQCFVPVRFGLKRSKNGTTTLYVVVDQNQIPLNVLKENKKTEVVKTTASPKVKSSASRSVAYSISQIIPFVNSKDVLRYIPDDMLSAEQKKIKWEGIAETIKKTNKKNDERYATYISEGNLDAAKRMVIAAAKEAGYTTEAWHGSRHEFTIFSKEKRGSNTHTQVSNHWFFAADKETANSYYPYGVMTELQKQHPEWKWANPETLKEKGKLYHLYLKMENPLIVDVADYDYDSHRENADAWMEYIQQAEENGNDGIILLNALDNQLKPGARESTVYMFKEPAQAKSADVITRDENNNVIPLSERFNSEKDEMLYSIDDGSDSVSTRSLLANALESVAQNDIERNKLKEYKSKIALIEAEYEKLTKIREEVRELSFPPKGTKRDTERINALRFEEKQAANRVNTYDRQLLNLEATKALKDVVEREKKMAYKKAEREGKEALARYREKAAKTQRELLTRYQESRAKGVEGRKKTEMRHKIKAITSELDTLLRRPTAKKHIKEELRAEVADALLAINMDTVGADERVAHYNEMIARAKDPDIIAELTKTRDRIQLQGDTLKEKLATLQNAYEKIKASDDVELSMSYQEVIHNSIKNVSDKVGNTSIRNMSLEQLEMVYDLFSMIRKTIRNANKAFNEQKGQTIMQMAEAVNDQVRTVGGERYKRNAVVAALQREGWTLLKPYVAFRTIGSVTLTNLYKELRNGEDTFYGDVKEAQAFIEEQYKKHGYKSWDMKKTKTFTAKSGKSFDLTLEQMMTLYAYSRREQAHKHIIEGGIVFEDAMIVEKNKWGVPIKYEVTTKDAFNLSEETFKGICAYLEENHKDVVAFVKDMQAYLSDTMGAKGNEVSMELLGVKLFKEEFYLPIKSSQYYRNFSAEEAGEVKLKSPAFSKETVQHANNPIVLHNFTDLWAEHINDMSMYHSFVLALEDFTRVYNYKTKTDDKVETMDTKATLETAYSGVTKYINKFLKDMNGGVRGETVGWAEKLTSLAKKGSVLGSASVAIQQPSAVMRAMAMVDPKHFVATTAKSLNLAKHKEDWAELKKYAPIAGIKEMGRFDVGMGQGTVDWIQSNKTMLNKAEDVLSAAPAFMDEVTWVSIWNAVKRETVHNRKDLRPGSDEFLKAAGERFTDVISMSQVYDSVFARSDIMRNKSWIAKATTAFMAEPTTVFNMMFDAYVQGKRTGSMKGFLKAAAPTSGAIVASYVLNALLKSIITAARDDDEDESYAEKYLEHFVGDFKDSLNPLTLVPIVKDVVSIFQGYDVERMDMALFSDLNKAIEAFNSGNKTLYEKWSGLIGATSAFFGIPVKNVERDIRAAINVFFGKRESTTKQGLLDAISEGWTGESKSNGQQLYEAMVSGDTEQIERVKGRFKDDKAITSAIRTALRDNDSRIHDAAVARYSGNIAEYTRIARSIIAEGHFKQDDVVAAINAEINALKKGEGTTDSTAESNKAASIYKVEDYFTAIVGRDQATAYVVKEDIIKTAMANGKDRDEAEADFYSSFASHLRDEFEAGTISNTAAIDMLVDYGGKTEEAAESKVQYWAFKKKYPDYDLSEEAVTKYYSDVEPSGIGVAVYYDYYKQRAKCKGVDLNGDGKTDSGSVKSEVLEVINSLPITYSQKDVLYYLNGWSASTIYEAPWH